MLIKTFRNMFINMHREVGESSVSRTFALYMAYSDSLPIIFYVSLRPIRVIPEHSTKSNFLTPSNVYQNIKTILK